MRKTVINTGIILVLSYFLMLVIVYFKQDGMLYHPEKEIGKTPMDIPLDFDEVAIKTKDGITISGWYIPAEHEKGVVLICHGNAGNVSHRLDTIRIFHRLNLSVLIFDYRGYGRSEGKPSEEGTYLDAEAAWEYLVHGKKKPPQQIIIFGRSLGGAVAAEVAMRKNPAILIIESSFISVPEIGKSLYPWLPVKLLSKYKYATMDKMGSIHCPTLVIHSPEDEIVPFRHGEQIYAKALQPKEFLKIEGGHNEGFLLSGGRYTDGLRAFLEKYLCVPY
jgi:fermentation-respiration switch protein FrsA (DUF1100 family)